MKKQDAYDIGFKRGKDAVKHIENINQEDRTSMPCTCAGNRMCSICLTFAAFTYEELRRINQKNLWDKLYERFKAGGRRPKRVEEAFEEGVFNGVTVMVSKRLKRIKF